MMSKERFEPTAGKWSLGAPQGVSCAVAGTSPWGQRFQQCPSGTVALACLGAPLLAEWHLETSGRGS